MERRTILKRLRPAIAAPAITALAGAALVFLGLLCCGLAPQGLASAPAERSAPTSAPAPGPGPASDPASARVAGETWELDLGKQQWYVRQGFQASDPAGLDLSAPGVRAAAGLPIFPNAIFEVPVGPGLQRYVASVRFRAPPEPERGRLVLLFPSIGEFYEVILNARSLVDTGASQPREGHSRYRRDLLVPIPPGLLRAENTLVVRLAGDAPPTFLTRNTHLGLGSSQGVVIGPEDPIRIRLAETIQLILYGAYLFFGLYHLLFFAYRVRERYHLYFGLFSIALSAYLLAFSQWAFSISPSFALQMRVAYPAQPLALGLFVLFLNAFFFNEEKHRRLLLVLNLGNAVVMVAMLVLPSRFLLSTLLAWYLVAAPQLGYMVFVMVIVLVRRLPYARRTAAGLLVGIGFVVWDILDTVVLNTQVRLTQYAHLLVIVSLVTVLAQRFLDVHAASERLNDELASQKDAFARFVPREFLDLLNQKSVQDIGLGDHTERELTILVADIRRFGHLSESMSPSDNFRFLNAFLSRVGPLIRGHNGFIDKYIGDAIMALFTGADDAVQAAVEIRRSVFEYNQHRHNSGYEPIDFGIGIHTGKLVLGTIGEAERMEGTVISDHVNLAFRLEETTKILGAPVILSVDTLHRLNDPTVVGIRFLGKLHVKHRDEAASMYELLDGLDEKTRDLRIGTRQDFERALFDYYGGSVAEANEQLKGIAERDPGDRAIAYYLEQCRAAV